MNLIFLLIGVIVCPVGYFCLLESMAKRGVVDPPTSGLFCLFGTLGGWCLAIGFAPSGISAICMIFLMTVSPIAIAVTTAVTWRERSQSGYHRITGWVGVCYLAIVVVGVLVALVSNVYSA